MRSWRKLVSLALCSFVLALPSLGADAPKAPVPSAEAFGKLPRMESPQISPDGAWIAYLTPVQGRVSIAVASLKAGGDAKPQIIAPSDAEMSWVRWVNSDRLLVGVHFTKEVDGGTRGRIKFVGSYLISLDRDGRNMVELTARDGDFNPVLLSVGGFLRVIDHDHVMMLLPTKDGGGHIDDIVSEDVYTGRTTFLARGHDEAVDYAAGPPGSPYAALFVHEKSGKAELMIHDGGTFRPVREFASREEAYYPLGYGDDPNILYVSAPNPAGRRAVFGFDLTTRQLAREVASDPELDVAGAIRVGGKVAGALKADGRQIFFDPGLQAIADGLNKAVPHSRQLLHPAAIDSPQILVEMEHDYLPLSYALYDRATHHLAVLKDTYPQLPDESLSERRIIAYPARDGTTIPAYLTLPAGKAGNNLPFVVLPHGGPAAHDEPGFDWLAEFLASRGYGVLQPQFRGSDGYGRAFREAGYGEWGGLMQDDVTDGAEWAIKQNYADPARLCIVGWSYGGYAALMGVAKTPTLFKCAASIAGVTDLEQLYRERDRFDFSQWHLSKLAADAEAARKVSPTFLVDHIRSPVLLIHGEQDGTVDYEHAVRMKEAMEKAHKPVELVTLPDMDHYARTEADRAAVLRALERFLAANIGQ
ncbi:MAG TPA: S9 family peptidase [Magnetospirillaceae bacterium]|nr:S9 family peptidase [Magnetospirillaceae bacterium]